MRSFVTRFVHPVESTKFCLAVHIALPSLCHPEVAGYMSYGNADLAFTWRSLTRHRRPAHIELSHSHARPIGQRANS